MSIATHTALANDQATPRREPNLGLRGIEPGDHDVAARITYMAFAGIHDRHRFPRDFPTLDVARELVAAFSTHPSIWGVVAESDGRVVGSNFLDERGPVRGVGPITVDPDAQAAGVGRLLMEAAIERGARADGIRLLQDSFNTASLALYSSLGFRVEEPVALMAGTPSVRPRRGVEVRPLGEDASRLARNSASTYTGSSARANSATRSRRLGSTPTSRCAGAGSWPTPRPWTSSAPPTRSPSRRTTCPP